LQLPSVEVRVVLGLAADACNVVVSRAHIGVVQVQADALGQLRTVPLPQAVVGAAGARLGAVGQGVDGGGKDAGIDTLKSRG
jgi:hypothetical protein